MFCCYLGMLLDHVRFEKSPKFRPVKVKCSWCSETLGEVICSDDLCIAKVCFSPSKTGDRLDISGYIIRRYITIIHYHNMIISWIFSHSIQLFKTHRSLDTSCILLYHKMSFPLQMQFFQCFYVNGKVRSTSCGGVFFLIIHLIYDMFTYILACKTIFSTTVLCVFPTRRGSVIFHIFPTTSWTWLTSGLLKGLTAWRF